MDNNSPIGYKYEGKMFFDNEFLELVTNIIDSDCKESFIEMTPYILQLVSSKELQLKKLRMYSVFIQKLDSYLIDFYDFELAHELIFEISRIRNS